MGSGDQLLVNKMPELQGWIRVVWGREASCEATSSTSDMVTTLQPAPWAIGPHSQGRMDLYVPRVANLSTQFPFGEL